MNAFVDYLNSMHNIKGDGLGALAERQIQSPYSKDCHVPRRLGQIIADGIRSGNNKAYIITGHAGDGKTSILVQVLRELGMIQPGELLSWEKECINAQGKLYYVKDMSEVRPSQRAVYLKKALNAPSNGMSSILISNTGPLLSSFEDVVQTDREADGLEYESIRLEVQTELLNQLDSNQGGERTIGGYTFSMINIARIDNVSFAGEFLDRILSDSLWLPCQTCEKRGKCPICHNRELLKNNADRVKAFINAYLRYAYEFDQRLTIRQIQAQICYALTGGLSCNGITPYRTYSYFKYGFSNLFFGYQGGEEYADALKVKAIRMLHDMNLDAIALPIDYDLFVKGQTESFPTDVQETIKVDILTKLKILNRGSDADIKNRNKKMIALRRSLRRYFLLLGDIQRVNGFDCVFGEGFSIYEEASSTSHLPKPKLNKIRDYIFNALYLDNTGFLPQNGSDNQVPLTLHRKDGIFQSVMLVLGHAPKSDLKIVQREKDCEYEDDQTRQRVMLDVKSKRFFISLPLFLYFVNQSTGAVTPACNPALTHNITRLETMLVDVFRNEDVSDIELLTNTTKGQKYQSLYISEDRIHLG